MKLELLRIILFTAHLEVLGRFYGEVLGLELANSEAGWREYRAGAVVVALHEGEPKIGKRPPKLAFYAADVAATRAVLIRRGAKMAKSYPLPASISATGRIPTAMLSRFPAGSDRV